MQDAIRFCMRKQSCGDSTLSDGLASPANPEPSPAWKIPGGTRMWPTEETETTCRLPRISVSGFLRLRDSGGGHRLLPARAEAARSCRVAPKAPHPRCPRVRPMEAQGLKPVCLAGSSPGQSGTGQSGPADIRPEAVFRCRRRPGRRRNGNGNSSPPADWQDRVRRPPI